MTISTELFTTPTSAYMRRVMMHSALRLWWLILLPMVAAAIAAVADLRWGFVALIWLFLVAPFIMANAYFNRLLTPEARRAILPQRVFITPGSEILIRYYDLSEETPHKIAQSPDAIGWDSVEGVYVSGDYIEINLPKSPLGILLIPRSAITESDISALFSGRLT